MNDPSQHSWKSFSGDSNYKLWCCSVCGGILASDTIPDGNAAAHTRINNEPVAFRDCQLAVITLVMKA